MSEKLLTKSLLISAIECPTKLYYAAKEHEYANQSKIDPFLKELAKGGRQVGELAKLYFPEGQEIKALNIDEAVAETRKLLQRDRVTIFEAAISHNNLFVRIDVLIKDGDHFDLIEVKAKSYDANSTLIIGKRGGIISEWKPKILDVAYQTHVLQLAYSESVINSYLMLINKNSTAHTNGLYQKFKLVEGSDQRISVEVSDDFSVDDLVLDMLVKVNVDEAIKMIFEEDRFPCGTFFEEVDYLAEQLKNSNKINPILGGKCRKCEFKCTSDDERNGLKSGFKECWQQVIGWSSEDFLQANVLEIWNMSSNKLDSLIANGKVKLTDIRKNDIHNSSSAQGGMSRSQRQWLQIDKVQNNDITTYLDVKAIKEKIKQWVFPLHFIDFETCKSAIPFIKGQRPYELVAFQFSHHTVDVNGTVTHAGQYLNVNQGEFPNYDFVRELRNNLCHDNGTIFQYAQHENTTLNEIYTQLLCDRNPPDDKNELCIFIRSITTPPSNSKEDWESQRCMVDMLDLVIHYYYDPATHGKNSIKDILPAILSSSPYLREKYSKPIYGAKSGIKSSNFHNCTWIDIIEGRVVNPYKLLPNLFDKLDPEKLDYLSEDEIQNGGAALMAYCKMQFPDLKKGYRNALCERLLKYCELDSLAMVMLYEGWRSMLDVAE